MALFAAISYKPLKILWPGILNLSLLTPNYQVYTFLYQRVKSYPMGLLGTVKT